MFEVIIGTVVFVFALVLCYFIGKYMSPMPNNSGKVITALDIIEMKKRENNSKKWLFSIYIEFHPCYNNLMNWMEPFNSILIRRTDYGTSHTRRIT